MKPEELEAIRQAVADYMESEGCSCCSDIDAHDAHTKRLAQLLRVPMYGDGSGYDFSKFRTSTEQVIAPDAEQKPVFIYPTLEEAQERNILFHSSLTMNKEHMFQLEAELKVEGEHALWLVRTPDVGLWKIRRDENGHATAIMRSRFDILHLAIGSARNEATVQAVVDLLNSERNLK